MITTTTTEKRLFLKHRSSINRDREEKQLRVRHIIQCSKHSSGWGVLKPPLCPHSFVDKLPFTAVVQVNTHSLRYKQKKKIFFLIYIKRSLGFHSPPANAFSVVTGGILTSFCYLLRRGQWCSSEAVYPCVHHRHSWTYAEWSGPDWVFFPSPPCQDTPHLHGGLPPIRPRHTVKGTESAAQLLCKIPLTASPWSAHDATWKVSHLLGYSAFTKVLITHNVSEQ